MAPLSRRPSCSRPPCHRPWSAWPAATCVARPWSTSAPPANPTSGWSRRSSSCPSRRRGGEGAAGLGGEGRAGAWGWCWVSGVGGSSVGHLSPSSPRCPPPQQEEAVGHPGAGLRPTHHHLRQPEEGLRRAGQVPGEDGGESGLEPPRLRLGGGGRYPCLEPPGCAPPLTPPTLRPAVQRLHPARRQRPGAAGVRPLQPEGGSQGHPGGHGRGRPRHRHPRRLHGRQLRHGQEHRG